MQSCPRCGARVGTDVRICPACGVPLSPFPGPAPSQMAEMPPLAQSPRELSPNGSVPQAQPTAAPGSAAAHPSGERWGPNFWGPAAPAMSEYLAPTPGPASAAPPIPGQPPILREYGAASAARPYPPYPAPADLSGPAAPGYPIPGYPLIPQTGQPPAYPGYAVQPGYAPYPGAPGYPYGWYVAVRPRAPGETYRKALSIITIVAASLLILGGLGWVLVIALLGVLGSGQDLSSMNLLLMFALASLAGGAAGLYHPIRALLRRQSAPFSLPSFWMLLALTVVILGAGIALFAAKQSTGSLLLVEPLVLLSGIVPSVTVLALALQLLRPHVTWRHAALALTTGATLSVGVASLLEAVLALALLGAASLNINLSELNPNGSFGAIAILILVAAIAPLVEETTKQISGFFLLPRLKGPQEAFLIGLAAGIGFAMVESSGYIGQAQADWVGIALGRVGAGLLHGMGAAMAGVGWYYLFRGKGFRGRWRIGIGCLLYAYAQHAIFNGSQVLVVLIPAVQSWHVDFFGLVFDITSVCAGFLYLVIILIMLAMIRWLRRSAPTGVNIGNAGQPAPNLAAGTPPGSGGTPIVGAAPSNVQRVGEPGSREWRGYV